MALVGSAERRSRTCPRKRVSSLRRPVDVMVVLLGHVGRQVIASPGIFQKEIQGRLGFGNNNLDAEALWELLIALQNHHAINYHAIKTHGKSSPEVVNNTFYHNLAA